MNKYFSVIKINSVIVILFLLSLPLLIKAQNEAVSLTIHLRGVYESKISISVLAGSKPTSLVTEMPGVKNGEKILLLIPKEKIPGEFVIRFDYKEKKESAPYPSEKYIFINKQDLELWVSPMYCNNPDSTWFQKEEKENTAYALFSKENSRQKEKLGLLQQFLSNYDDTESKFYQQGVTEYEQRRQAYNQWIDDQAKADKALFVSSMYRFHYIPQIQWEGTEKDRMLDMIIHYFDGIDFSDPIITRTTQLNEWMNNYVNLYGQMATSVALRDSLIPVAAKTAIEKAKHGNPTVYGWMVDYFYRGFESNNLPEGMKVLEPYLNDPGCLTSKRMEIERRLKGMKTLVTGSKAPNFELKDTSGNTFNLNNFVPSSNYILLIFWSADCGHCVETTDAIFPWLQQPENKQKISVIAVSLDETTSEIKAWEQKIVRLDGWKHLRAPEGVRSKIANDYYILATPVMLLLDSKNKEVIALPDNLNELKAALK